MYVFFSITLIGSKYNAIFEMLLPKGVNIFGSIGFSLRLTVPMLEVKLNIFFVTSCLYTDMHVDCFELWLRQTKNIFIIFVLFPV